MRLKLERKKKKNLKLSLAYRLSRLLPMNSDKKLKLFLDVAWIFSRLAHEETFRSTVYIGGNVLDTFLLDGVPASCSLLDIGCGKGYIMKQLQTKTNNILGVDYNKEDIEYLAQHLPHPDIKVICDDIFNYMAKLEGVYFDVIVLSHVVEHIDEPEPFLARLVDKAKTFYIEVPDFESNYQNAYREKLGTDLVYSDADHVSEFRREDMEEMFKKLHLRILGSEFRGSVMKYWLASKANFEGRPNWKDLKK
jgi:SAM-dependent methyltransferase